jgi:ankyrin repeat protein
MPGVDVNGQFDGGARSPALSREKKVEVVRLLIERGMDVTTKDENLSTPLHLASSSGVPEIVRLLIESGADVTDKDGSGRTPLHLASSWVSAKAPSRVTLVTSYKLTSLT